MQITTKQSPKVVNKCIRFGGIYICLLLIYLKDTAAPFMELTKLAYACDLYVIPDFLNPLAWNQHLVGLPREDYAGGADDSRHDAGRQVGQRVAQDARGANPVKHLHA
jgi:hypothetical protein